MTKQELQAFKQQISKALDIGADSSCIYTFLPDDIQEAGESSFSLDKLVPVADIVTTELPYSHVAMPIRSATSHTQATLRMSPCVPAFGGILPAEAMR